MEFRKSAFDDPEHIVDLLEYLSPDRLFEIIGVVFTDSGEYSKTGCFEYIKPQSADDVSEEDYLAARNNVSEILSAEGIPHEYAESGTKMMYIGDLSLLPAGSPYLGKFNSSVAEERELAKVSRFIGVPEADNVHLESTEWEYDDGYPVEHLDIPDYERFHLRMISWSSKPTRDGVERAMAQGKSMYEALLELKEQHPEYAKLLQYMVYSRLFSTSGKFYGKFSEPYRAQLESEQSALQSELETIYDLPFESWF